MREICSGSKPLTRRRTLGSESGKSTALPRRLRSKGTVTGRKGPSRVVGIGGWEGREKARATARRRRRREAGREGRAIGMMHWEMGKGNNIGTREGIRKEYYFFFFGEGW